MFDRKAYDREYHRRNRDGRLKQSREWRRKNPEKVVASSKRYKEKKRDEADDLLGNECFFCGRTRDEGKLLYHKKDGQPHSYTCEAAHLVIKNPDDWALVCHFPCHHGVHWCLEVWKLSWEETVEVFKANSRFGKRLVTVNFEKPSSCVVDDLNELGMQCAKDLEPLRRASQEMNNVFE